jgi:hypothetical protein
MFKVGGYQYSKLLQEKLVDKYKEVGLNTIKLEFPEVISSNYRGTIYSIIRRLRNNRKTIVHRLNMSTIGTRDISLVFREFIEGNPRKGYSLFRKSIKTFDLYEHIDRIVKEKFPDKKKYLKKGNGRLRSIVINKDKTIIFPDFEYPDNK